MESTSPIKSNSTTKNMAPTNTAVATLRTRSSSSSEHSSRVNHNQRVVINISGEIYETYVKTLQRFPRTLLGDFEKRNVYYCSTTQQYFFNRNRLCFGAILYFYQSCGMLTCPLDIKLEDFEQECLFFQLPIVSIKKMKMKRGIMVEDEDQNENEDEEEDDEYNESGGNSSRSSKRSIIKSTTHRKKCMNYTWDVLENPETSYCASSYAVFSLFMVFVSVLVACMETVDDLQHLPWANMEFYLNIWFITELIFRTIFCPNKRKYFNSTMTWVDGLAVIPYFFTLLLDNRRQLNSLDFLRIIRFLKIMRLFRLSRHSKRLKIVGSIIKSSLGDLQLLLLCLSILMIFGGSLMYYIEGVDDKTQFQSIPQSLWWAVQTITTVGYGDITPSTEFGKILAASFMLFGAVTISLPVLSIVAKFTTLYSSNMP